MEEFLSLKWNNHCSTFLQVLCDIRSKHQYSDITLVCENKYYHVHKMVLSTCSDYFKNMFDKLGHHQMLVIVLNDVKAEHFDMLLDYMYLGEVNVKQIDLPALIKTSELLQIKGLAVADEPFSNSSQTSSKRRSESPIAKRKKKQKKIDNNNDSHNANIYKSSKSDSLGVFHQESGNVDEKATVTTGLCDLVKEEPLEFTPEEIILDNEYEQSNSEPIKKAELEQIPEYEENTKTNVVEEEHLDTLRQMDESLRQMDDSNFSSSSFPDQSQNWEDSNLSMNLDSPSMSGTTDNSQLKMRTVCEWCGKKFACQSALKRHLFIHTGEKPYHCDHCDYRTNQKAALKRHYVLMHVLNTTTSDL